jgi:Cu(I)/Ag(I) efflux system membrane fusion protein
MAGQRANAIVKFITVGLISILFSCKMQPEETITESAPPDTHIRLSDAQIQLANINLTEAREGSVGQKLSLTGVLKVNEQSAFTISTRLTGRIEKLYFRNTGETIKKGDKLYEFYSDDLIDAQREYFALQSNNWNYSGKYEPSLILKDKLLIMGLIPSQIKQLEKDGKILFRVTIYSPAGGKIRAINVTEGQYVTEGQSLFELADDNNLWVEAQVYPGEIQYFSQGMPAIAVIPSAGEVPVLCNISFIKPSFETDRNVTIIRAGIKNPDNRLHPGMLALLYVQTKISHGIIIPSSAVLTGAEGDRVWVRDENDDFSFRMVTTGTQSEDSILVLSGLEKSDKVVYTGAYLLNSELILRNGTGVSAIELPEFKVGKAE